ncbi:MAG TPA: hypothetical protein VKT32_17125, partial [Chthonomonadaceae bacterium]|nr:hypothetical protein [Chthonomonadaceae bacterium]
MRLDLDPEAIARLETRTEGWIAGLQLVALSLQGREDPSRFIASFAGSHRFILDYLVNEVLARQPEEVQAFLAETSVLNRLCGSLCDAVRQSQESQTLLERIEAGNLFLFPLDEERRWYRYHHLFADILQARLLQQGPERVAELHRRAAAWYEQQGILEEAIHHALEGRQPQMAAQLMEQHWDEVWRQGGQRTLEKWLKALPPECFQGRPMLSVIQATVLLYDIQVVAALEALDRCRLSTPVQDAGTQDVRGRAAVLRSNIVRFQGDMDLAADLARESLACLAPDNSIWRVSARFSLAVALFEGDRLAEADEALDAAIVESRDLGIHHICVPAAIEHARLQEARGLLQEAARIFETALAYATEQKYHYAIEMAVLFAGLARLRFQANDLDAAETFCRQGLERKHAVTPLFCYFALIRIRQAQHDAEGAAALVRHLEAVAQRSRLPWLPPALATVKMALELDSRPLRKAEATARMREYDTLMAGLRSPRMPFSLREQETLVRARLEMAAGQEDAAQARLESRLALLLEQGCDGSAMDLRVLLAPLQERQGRLDAAVAVLQPALALAAREAYLRVFLDTGPPLLPVLRECIARGIETDGASKVLDAFRAEGIARAQSQG